MGEYERLLTAKEVASMLQVHVTDVYRLPIRRTRIKPRTVRYRLEDVEEFLDNRTETP